MSRIFRKTGILLAVLIVAGISFADGPMKKIVEKDGLGIYFLFYSEGNGIEDNGVVIYLKNENDYKIGYSFNLVFRTPESEREQEVRGILNALERRTGSNDGLYFIPFSDKRSISEVGVRKIRIEKIKD
jgi:hypothetical protein